MLKKINKKGYLTKANGGWIREGEQNGKKGYFYKDKYDNEKEKFTTNLDIALKFDVNTDTPTILFPIEGGEIHRMENGKFQKDIFFTDEESFSRDLKDLQSIMGNSSFNWEYN